MGGSVSVNRLQNKHKYFLKYINISRAIFCSPIYKPSFPRLFSCFSIMTLRREKILGKRLTYNLKNIFRLSHSKVSIHGHLFLACYFCVFLWFCGRKTRDWWQTGKCGGRNFSNLIKQSFTYFPGDLSHHVFLQINNVWFQLRTQALN